MIELVFHSIRSRGSRVSIRGLSLFLSCLFFSAVACADPCTPEWGVIAYYARMTDATLNRVVRFNMGFSDANLVAFELDRDFDCNNVIRETFKPLVGQVGIAFNGTFQDDPAGSLVGTNAFLVFTWKHFPWDRRLLTSISLLEGVSYMFGHPQWECRTTEKAQNDRRFLNFLGAEITAAMPTDPTWQLVYRIHHRSGVFGLYSPGIVGSTAVGVGLRHTFI